MKILVLSGSPKGEDSITLQSLRYVAKKRPGWEFGYVHAGLSIVALERDGKKFDGVIELVREAEVVIWCSPVYHLLVPAQFKRFIELVHERGAAEAFRGKYAAAIVTSIHFFDHTALNYLRGVAEDLGMSYYDGYPAHMDDLTKETERVRLLGFFDGFFAAVAEGRVLPRTFAPLPAAPAPFAGGDPARRVSLGSKKTLLLADRLLPGSSLDNMVRYFAASCEGQIEIVQLADLDIKGGCMGCCNCGFDNVCAWTGKDGFHDFYEAKVKPAELLVYAGEMRDRALSSLWKTYFDRSFYNTHIPTYAGKQMAFLISGPLSANANLRQVLEAYPDVMQANPVGIVTDEGGASTAAELEALAARIAADAAEGYIRSSSFLGFAGRKIFRDDVFGGMRLIFRADHRYYKRHGFYDFPHRHRGLRLLSALLGPLFAIPRVKRGFKAMMKSKMVEGHKKAVAAA